MVVVACYLGNVVPISVPGLMGQHISEITTNTKYV